METKPIELFPSLQTIVNLGFVSFEQLQVVEQLQELEALTAERHGELRQQLADTPLRELDSVQRTRRLYHSFGMDPTRERPPSERLLRRVLKGSSLAPVNSFVDAMKLVSVCWQCPVGAYDWGCVAPPVVARIGKHDETYLSTSEERIRLEGRPLLQDARGPFGSPTSDSARAQVTLESSSALAIIWVPAGTPSTVLEEVLADLSDLAMRFCGGQVGFSGVLGRRRAA